MAQETKRGAKGAKAEDDIQQAQTVEELEKEMLGPKARKDPKEDKLKAPKEKKPVGRIEVALLASLVWLALIGAFVLLVLFDPTPDRMIRGTVLLRLNPDEYTREDYFLSDIIERQDEWREIAEEWALLEIERAELDLMYEELSELESDLDNRETELEARWDALRDQLAAVGGGVMGDASEAAKTLERMAPANAARLLEEMDFDAAMRALLLISPKRRAPIFDAMDPETSVEFLEAMAAEPDYDFGDDDGWN
jgi:flagellar motility protein MotE (MotC chaperone)